MSPRLRTQPSRAGKAAVLRGLRLSWGGWALALLDAAPVRETDRGPAPFSNDRGEATLAILTSVGEIDRLGTRKDGLDAFLAQKVGEGYVIETRTDTHA